MGRIEIEVEHALTRAFDEGRIDLIRRLSVSLTSSLVTLPLDHPIRQALSAFVADVDEQKKAA